MVSKVGRRKQLLFQWFDQTQRKRYFKHLLPLLIDSRIYSRSLGVKVMIYGIVGLHIILKPFQVGFLSDCRRMNVAVTRARRQCCLVCDTETVSSDGFLKRLVEYFEEHGEYLSASEYCNE